MREADKRIAFHVVTDRPMHVGQTIRFDETHHSGVYRRVMDKLAIVNDIYRHPCQYDAERLDHHTLVAFRELALEEGRQKKYPMYPSRMSCLYVSKTFEEAESWGNYFAKIGRPTYSIVRLAISGNCFIGDAAKCFDGTTNKEENLRLAEWYWENRPCKSNEQSMEQMLVDGTITVIEVLKEIHANIV